MLEKYNNVLSVSLSLWKYTGVNPLLFEPKRLILEVLILSMVIGLTIWEYLLDSQNFNVTTNIIHSLLTNFHILIFHIMNLFKHDQQLRLLEDVEQFWDYEQPEFEDNFKDGLTDAMNKIKKFLDGFRAYTIWTLFFLVTGSYISPQLMTLFCHIPQFVNYYILTTVINFVFIQGGLVIVGSGAFFLSIIFLLVIQFRILGQRLLFLDYSKVVTEDDEKACLEKIKICIKHHDFLMKVCAHLNNMYSVPLLCYFMINVSSMCLLLYVGLEKESTTTTVVRSGVYMFGITLELAINFCLPAEYLTGEAMNIAGYIYNSNWSECRYSSIKKDLTFMILRAQKNTVISAGKMMTVNLETCTQLFKSTLSFYTFLNSIKN